ncbi:MAG: cyclic nucleotide-binding domain-containing protein [Candidatus Magnetoovum sp. WYHC-5]|nr:cyclic nucleotide-binding domain-containing protein [Candidatus Magnetoovum sp. WYHC-5]
MEEHRGSEVEDIHEALIKRGLKKANVSFEEIGQMLDNSYLTKDMDWASIKTLGKAVKVYNAKKDTIIFTEGDMDAFLCLIVKGKVNIVKRDINNQEKVIASINHGRTFGEMSVIDGEPRSATAVAAMDTLLIMLSREDFLILSEETPRLAVILVMNVAKLMSQKLRMASGILVDHINK